MADAGDSTPSPRKFGSLLMGEYRVGSNGVEAVGEVLSEGSRESGEKDGMRLGSGAGLGEGITRRRE
jgi:hypothetical protein